MERLPLRTGARRFDRRSARRREVFQQHAAPSAERLDERADLVDDAPRDGGRADRGGLEHLHGVVGAWHRGDADVGGGGCSERRADVVGGAERVAVALEDEPGDARQQQLVDA